MTDLFTSSSLSFRHSREPSRDSAVLNMSSRKRGSSNGERIHAQCSVDPYVQFLARASLKSPIDKVRLTPSKPESQSHESRLQRGYCVRLAKCRVSDNTSFPVLSLT